MAPLTSSAEAFTNGAVKLGGPLGFLTATGFAMSSDSLLLVVAAVVFAAATYFSRAPGILRADNKALVEKVEQLTRDLATQDAALKTAQDEISVMKAKDTSALYDLLVRHDERAHNASQENTRQMSAIVQALTIVASGALADVFPGDGNVRPGA